MKLTKSEAKRKSYKIVESNSKNKTIVDKEKQNSIEEKNDKINFYKGIIRGKDYLQYCFEQMKIINQKQK